MIPKIIHLTWKYPKLTGNLKRCVDSHRIWNPDWEIRFYTDGDCEDLVNRCFPDYLETYRSFPPGIYRADVFRVLALQAHGGIYADIDIECRRPYEDLIEFAGEENWDVLLTRDHPIHERVHFNGRKMFMNDFFAARPNNRFLHQVMEKFKGRAAGMRNRHPKNAVFETGPLVFTEVVEDEYLLALQGQEASRIRYVPWERIHPIPDMSNSFDEKLSWEERIQKRAWLEDSDPFVVHYWHHTWCKGGTTLDHFGPHLLQTDGDVAESRIQKFLVMLGERTETLGIALCGFAESGGGDIVELGVTRSFVPAGEPGCMIPDKKYWYPEDPSSWDWGGGSFTRVVAEVLRGLPFIYRGIDPSDKSLAIAESVVETCHNGAFSFIETTASEFLKSYNGQAGLIYFDQGDSCEKTARMHELDAEIVVRRQLVKPGGYVLIDDHNLSDENQVPKSKYSRKVFEGAGFVTIEEGYQLLLQRPNSPIPPIFHVFVISEQIESTQDRLSRVKKLNENWDWSFEIWSVARVRELVLENFPEFSKTFDAYEFDADRIAVGRYLVAKHYGGVVMNLEMFPDCSFDSFLSCKELVFLSVKAFGQISGGEEEIADGFFASIPDHCFWDGICNHLTDALGFNRGEDRTGAAFLAHRIRSCANYLKDDHRPIVLGGIRCIEF